MSLNGAFIFPVTKKLGPQLGGMLNRVHAPQHLADIVRRKPFYFSSTSPAEVISCRMDDGQSVLLFCKYAGDHTKYAHGHRGGVEYETKIYKEVLQHTPLSRVHYYGQFRDDNRDACLVLEYLRDSKLLKDIPYTENFGKAGTWIGALHRMYESNFPAKIKKYDDDYYLMWVKRIEEHLGPLKKKYTWLPTVCNYFKKNMHLLSRCPQTFIHGEYYTKNILVKNGSVYPIDWESAAIGPGEIDLASLTESWGLKRENMAIKTYLKARWPNGKFSEREFEKRFLLVKLYFFLRWTGEHEDPEWWVSEVNWFKKFYRLAKQAGCV